MSEIETKSKHEVTTDAPAKTAAAAPPAPAPPRRFMPKADIEPGLLIRHVSKLTAQCLTSGRQSETFEIQRGLPPVLER
jgi:hypothetical protein